MQGLGAPKRTNVERVARRTRALLLRSQGWTLLEIAHDLGITKQGAFKLIAKALEKMERTTAEAARTMSVERLDRWTKAISPAADNGDLDAIDRGVRIEARRASLLGLDAPTKTDASVAVGMTLSPEQALQLAEGVRARAAQLLAPKDEEE